MAQDQSKPAEWGARSATSSASANAPSNAASLYERISQDPDLTQALFRQALQDPSGTLEQICRLGDDWGLPVSVDEVKAHISALDDLGSKQWLLKARGGL